MRVPERRSASPQHGSGRSFDLSGFTAQRIRMRWIGETWNFGRAGDYYDLATGWDGPAGDDGLGID